MGDSAFIAVQVRLTNCDIQHAELQAALLLRNDRSEKVIEKIKTILER